MQLDAGDLAKIVAAFGGLGGGFAFMRPFAEKFFSFHLKRIEERAAIEDAKSRAVERIAVQHERMTGVLERYDTLLSRIDARLDRLEAHHGISPNPSDIPPPLAPDPPRRALTDPDLRSSGSPPSPPSTRASAPA